MCAHYMFAQGGGEVARIHDDSSAIRMLGMGVRDRIRSENQTFEVALFDEGKVDSAAEPNSTPPPPKPEKPEAKPKPEAAKPSEPTPPKPEEKVVAVQKSDEKPHVLPPPEKKDQRIAVKQHAKKGQDDNPTAKFIADEANKVAEESAARLTSHDQDEAEPTPGGSHANSEQKPGDSDRTKIAQSEDRRGEKDRGPGDKGREHDSQDLPQTALQSDRPVAGPAAPAMPKSGGDGKPAASTNNTPVPALAAGGAGPAAPDTVQSGAGEWTFNPLRPGTGLGSSSDTGPGSASKQDKSGSAQSLRFGLGGPAAPGQVNFNLTHEGVVAVVGQDNLRKMREADGERRRSEHTGSWVASGLQRWKSAIENYVPTVRQGNQTALNTAAVPFASYLNAMHNRIHPIFADGFLDSLGRLPREHPLNDIKLMTTLEIVLSPQGHVVRMGVAKGSGITSFDVAALDSVQRASPFGPAPSTIVSPDGNVYLHWEFHRDEVFACSTMNARPFLLNVPPKPPEEPKGPPGQPPSPTRERGAPVDTHDTRQGSLGPGARVRANL